MNKLIAHFSQKQKSLFLVDSLGAFVTAAFLFVIVHHFNEYFGMPGKETAWLSAIAVAFSCYSAACYLFLKAVPTPFFRFIGIANLAYCALTIGLLVKYHASLTIIGIAYFLMEILIICALSYVELNVATRIKNKELKS